MSHGVALVLIIFFFNAFIGEAVTKRWTGSRSRAEEPCEHGHREGAQKLLERDGFCPCKGQSHTQVTVV